MSLTIEETYYIMYGESDIYDDALEYMMIKAEEREWQAFIMPFPLEHGLEEDPYGKMRPYVSRWAFLMHRI